MNRDANRVLKYDVNEAWQQAIYGLRQMNQSSLVVPADAYEIFRLDGGAPDDVVKLLVGPVVFNVPERPNHRRPDLFVVIRGWLTFEGPDFKSLPLKTKDFGTEVAYFRSKTGALEHVYGAHFDMDETRPGHPVFHVQFGPHTAFGADVHQLCRLDNEVVDKMGTILEYVRIASAQMDVFAVFTQICADHLMGDASAPEVRDAFKRLRRACDFLIGAAHRLPYLNSVPAINCYRSTHWYDSPAANA